MAYQWGRRPQDVQITGTGATIPYRLSGEWNENLAALYIRSNAPLTFGGWFRTDVKIKGQGGGIWDVDVEYGPASQKEPTVGDFKWTFDTTGQTKKLTQAVQHIATYVAAGATQIDHKGAIGVTDDSVEGVDVPDRAFKWAETWQQPLAGYGFTYSTVLGQLTGCVNNSFFRGFPAFTVRFDGAAGSQSLKEPTIVEITYNFSVSPSATGLVVGDITGIAKTGWDYLWVRYETADDATAKKTTPRPRQVEVDRVLYPVAFSLFGIGSGVIS